jgi:hypothetical protein
MKLRDWLRIVLQRSPNAYGGAYGLTSLIPVAAGEEDALEAHLAALDPLASPLAQLPRLHFSRLHVIRDLVYQGAPQERDPLRSSYLIFTTSHDGELDSFLRELAGLGAEVDAIFGHCRGYPGSGDRAAFARWVASHARDNGYFLTPWPFASVPDIRESLRVHRGFADLAERAGELDDAALQAAFRGLMRS